MEDAADRNADAMFAPFGRPLFDGPEARALSRVGVVDVGSNSVRLVVFDGAARSPAYFYNEKVMCGLGTGMAETGRLHPEGRERALSALRRFAKLVEVFRLPPLTAVATAAVREAKDGPDFRREVKRQCGLKLHVLDGREEARLSAQGVLLGWPGAYGLTSDIGGSSMELAALGGGRVGARVSTPLGPLRLSGLTGKALRRHIRTTLESVKAEIGTQRDRLFLVGGSWRAIARLDMLRRAYPMAVLHEYRMGLDDADRTIAFIRDHDMDELRGAAGVSETRAALVGLASEVLTGLLETFGPRDIAVSSYGIREGLLYEQMPEALRLRDPLIEACRSAEARDARMPGFGPRLHAFIAPLFPETDADLTRLIRAACLLHDVSWRAHPDYRHDIVFENATRANLAGITHGERVFLGLALLHRYKNSRGSRFDDLLGMLSEDDRRTAETLGKAMRLGAMLAAEAPDDMASLDWDRDSSRLTIRISASGRDLFGEVAASRFAALASAMGAEPVVVDA